jgi:hypothetical protein
VVWRYPSKIDQAFMFSPYAHHFVTYTSQNLVPKLDEEIKRLEAGEPPTQ